MRSPCSGDSRVRTLLDKLHLRKCLRTETAGDTGDAGSGPSASPVPGTATSEDYAEAFLLLEEERRKFLEHLVGSLDEATASEEGRATVQDRNDADRSRCRGCGACVGSCPAGAVDLLPDDEGFRYPRVDAGRCVRCGLCVRVCRDMERHASVDDLRKAYACRNLDAGELAGSSSGGVFIALARAVVRDGGTVFGAAFDERWRLLHRGEDTMEGLRAFQGSKYLQSDLQDCFRQVGKLLKSGRKVLFSGTPCQVAGLKAFLNASEGRPLSGTSSAFLADLLAADLICHGTPSQKAFDAYLADHADLGRIGSVSFRSKERGWARFSMRMDGDRGSCSRDLRHDPYLRAFLADLDLRPSCYACRFKDGNSQADVTLADFWGLARLLGDGMPGLSSDETGTLKSFLDDAGTSLVLVHTEKGRDALKAVETDLGLVAVPYDKAIGQNAAATRSVLMPDARREFYARIGRQGFDRAVREMLPVTMSERKGFLKERVYELLHGKR